MSETLVVAGVVVAVLIWIGYEEIIRDRPKILKPILYTVVILLGAVWAGYEFTTPLSDKQLCEVFLGKPRCVGLWMNGFIEAAMHPAQRR